MKLTIDRVQRLGVIEDLPYAKMIGDNELRELVYDAWAMSLSSSSFDRINDMACSGGPGGPELPGRGQAAHLNGVARIGVSIAQGLKDEVGHFRVDIDEVIAGGLCHDLGKAWEYDPGNIERWSDPRITGAPSMRHPVFGVFVALTAGLPEQIAHIAGGHSAEGLNITRSLAGEIIAIADETFWKGIIYRPTQTRMGLPQRATPKRRRSTRKS